MAVTTSSRLQSMLQTAVQTVQWTYSLFWQLCPQQGILVWSDGYYNGAIKTRKTVQPMEVTAEEATLQRSQQLRELYDSLAAGEASQAARRPSAALSPEDLTESEWFYLMCISFSFPPGVGLPGKAFAKRQHVWLNSANECESKVFSRAILAKSARIQTVVCIPLLDGVIELGTTEKVEEDLGLIQTVKSLFIDHQYPPPPKPALSEHSTSNPTTSEPRFTLPSTYRPVHHSTHTTQMDEEEDEDEDEDEAELDSESETGHNGSRPPSGGASHTAADPSELMQLDMSEDIRVGSPDDGSNNLDSDFHMLAVSHNGKWPLFQYPKSGDLQPPPSGILSPSLDELIQDDSHYSQTISIILHHQSSRWSNPSTTAYVIYSPNSAFTKWPTTNSTSAHHPYIDASSSQWLLKYILFTVPLLHSKPPRDVDGTADSATHFRKLTPQEELSANHVLAERRRREKLNERFIILRSLVPFVTKMDKASILGDTIEYVKQLSEKIQDLEARERHLEAELSGSRKFGEKKKNPKGQRGGPRMGKVGEGMEKRKMRIVERGGNGGGKPTAVVSEQTQAAVEVSIIENDALIEVECPEREGLLLDVMQMLREVGVEITAVQSSVNNGVFSAELRAKVMENVNGKKVSITEVKRAVHQVIH